MSARTGFVIILIPSVVCEMELASRLPRTVFLTAFLCCLVHSAVSTVVPLMKLEQYSASSRVPEDNLHRILENRTITVHVVPHTHDDVGWLKTVDEYYYGANNSIQHAAVQYILDSVIQELQVDPSRTFIYVEIAFFARWWDEQTDQMKETVKKLVANKQLEFVNAGWCMNDEASTHYNAIIDQMTLGMRFVLENFGEEARPRVAWQIDPFGHSSQMATTFALMGYDGLFFWRNDYDDRNQRLKDNTMEMVWRSSSSLGPSSDLFTGVLFYGYGAPPGFCYDVKCKDPPIQDDERLFDYNVDERVDEFIKVILTQAGNYRTDHVMFTMGSDFHHENSHEWYKNLDKLMKYTMMKEPRIKLMYSTPSRYLEAVNKANLSWTVKTDDFFPYADNAHAFWTGYFTSRPALKGYVREMNSLLQSCKQLEVIGTKPSVRGNLAASSQRLQEAVGVAQHHDAVSGTEKQHVADDYAKRLHIGQVECQELISDVVTGLASQKTKSQNKVLRFEFCENLNISVCNITESDNFDVIIYNPVARPRIALTKYPVNSHHFIVTDDEGNAVTAQVVEVTNATVGLRGNKGSLYELVISPNIPPLGYKTFFVRTVTNLTMLKSAKVTRLSKAEVVPMNVNSDIGIENDAVLVTFDSINCGLKSITNKVSKISLDVHQGFFWYHPWGNEMSFEGNQRSGAYIFRPYGNKPNDVTQDGGVEQLSIVEGDVYTEVQQVFNSWVSQSVRIFPGLSFVEFEYTIGPLPYENYIGKEVVSRFSTDLATNGTWYTDSNGREMQKRIRNYRQTWKYENTEPIAGNYYPVNSRIYIRDDSRNVQFTVLTDRSQGGSSIEDGQVELMVHRRLMYDDGRGVDESLDEPGENGKGLVIRGHHIVLVDDFENSYNHRLIGEFLMMKTVTMVMEDSESPDIFRQNFNGSFTGLIKALPSNVHLLTLQYLGESKCLIRLDHQFAVGEDHQWSSSQNVSLASMFVFDIVSVVELGLGANTKLPIDRLKWTTDSKPGNPSTSSRRPVLGPEFIVELNPMDIRTFEVEFLFK